MPGLPLGASAKPSTPMTRRTPPTADATMAHIRRGLRAIVANLRPVRCRVGQAVTVRRRRASAEAAPAPSSTAPAPPTATNGATLTDPALAIPPAPVEAPPEGVPPPPPLPPA